MVAFKNIVRKLLCYTGAAALLLCFFCIVWDGAFLSSGGSMTLIALSVFLLAAALIACVHFYSTAVPRRRPDVKNSSVLLVVAVIALAAGGIRVIAFILTDARLVSLPSVAVCVSAALNTVLIYCIAARMMRHSCGVAAAVLYGLWGGCEMLFLAHSGEDGLPLLCSLAAQSLALAAVLFLFLSVKTRSHNGALFSCVLSGLAAGCAAAIDCLYLLLTVSVVTYYLFSDTRIRKKKIWQRKPYAIRRPVFIFLHAGFMAGAFAVLTPVLYYGFRIPLLESVRSFTLPSPGGALAFFKEADASFLLAAAVLSVPRSYWMNYIMALLTAVVLLLGAFGAFAAERKHHAQETVLAEFLLLLVGFAVVFHAVSRAFLVALPFALLLSVSGMYAAGEFMTVIRRTYVGRTGGRHGHRNPQGGDGASRNPEHAASPEENGKSGLTDRRVEKAEDPYEEPEEEPEDFFVPLSPESSPVASGEDQQSLLESLAEGKYEHEQKP